MVVHMQRRCLHIRKASRRLPCIDALFKVQLFYGIEKYRSTLLHSVTHGNIQLFNQYLTCDYGSQLWETWHDTVRVQVRLGKPPVLWKKHNGLVLWNRYSKAVLNQSVGKGELANVVLHPRYVLLLYTKQIFRAECTRTSPIDTFILRMTWDVEHLICSSGMCRFHVAERIVAHPCEHSI